MTSLRTFHRVRLLFALVLFSVASTVFAQASRTVSIHQLSDDYGFPYGGTQSMNLSGFVGYKGRLFIVGDKGLDRSLYEIRKEGTQWRIISRVPLKFSSPSDLEGAFYSATGLFLVNESQQRVYWFDFDGNSAKRRRLTIDFPKSMNSENWGNAGLEGVAYDDESGLLYLAKERAPRAILVFAVKESDGSSAFIKQFDIQPPAGALGTHSFSDLYFENGFLYALERRSLSVAKIDTETEQVVGRLDFSWIIDTNGGLYDGDPNSYGLAEALLLTSDMVLIGLDNNGKPINDANKFAQRFNLNGTQPTILQVPRPAGF